MKIAFFLILAFVQLLPLPDTHSSVSKKTSSKNPINISHTRDYVFDVLHYKIEVTPNYADSSLTGKLTSRLLIKSDTLHIVGFNLDDCTVNTVTCNDTTISFEQKDSMLYMTLPHTYSNQDTITLSIDYYGVPTEGMYFHRRNGSTTFNFVDTFGLAMTGSPERNHHWYPCLDTPDDKVLMDIYVTVPQAYTVASNGLLIEVNQSGNNKIYHWRESYPISNYLIAFVAGELTEVDGGTYKGMPITHYAFNEDAEKAKTSFENTNKFLQCFETLFAPYPFINEKFGFAEMLNFGGGMENQTLVFIHQAYITGGHEWDVGLYAHEASHMWWGDCVTNGTFKDIWLNEGFASYCEPLYLFYDTQDTVKFRRYMTTFAKQVFNSSHAWDWSVYGLYEEPYNEINYRKGAWVLHMLRHELGDSTFFSALKSYYNKYYMGCVVTTDFIEEMEAISGKDLGDFFSQWVYEPGYPDLVCLWEVKPDSVKGYTVKIELTQNQHTQHPTTPIYDIPVEIKLKSSTRDTFFVFKLDKEQKEEAYHLSFKPDSIIIDPYEWLLDKTKVAQTGFKENKTAMFLPVKGLDLSTYPNPFKDKLKIEISNDKDRFVYLCLYDISGRLCKTILTEHVKKGERSITLDGNGFNPGVYVLRLNAGDKIITKRLIHF